MSGVSPSLAIRGVIAILLTLGFYTLAIALAAFLVLAVLVDLQGGRIHLQLILFCGIGAITILWALLPRFDRFHAPGPVLLPEDHPRLFELLRSVAARTHQEMPREVYLVPDVNAWVAQRGGVMGIGSRRVMGLGLPALQALTVSQLEAVLAHEFGHFHGGDTGLGPFIYRTRAAVLRMVSSVDSSILRMPFVLYAKLYLRITQAISRWQEFAADRLSAEVVGRQPLIEGLKRIHAAASAYNVYWHEEVVPVLSSGHRPPIAVGFSQFLDVPRIADATDAMVADQIEKGATNPYDSHPALPERIRALEAVTDPGTALDSRPAISLLEHVDALEAALVRAMAPDAELETVTWGEIGSRVALPAWRRARAKFAAVLDGYLPADYPDAVKELDSIGERMRNLGASVPDGQFAGLAVQGLSVALGLELVKRGWTLDSRPGAPILLRLGEESLVPQEEVAKLADGNTSKEEWQQRLQALRL